MGNCLSFDHFQLLTIAGALDVTDMRIICIKVVSQFLFVSQILSLCMCL